MFYLQVFYVHVYFADSDLDDFVELSDSNIFDDLDNSDSDTETPKKKKLKSPKKGEPSHEKTNNLGFRPGPTQTCTVTENGRSLNLWIYIAEEWYCPCSENKGAVQFSHNAFVGFLMRRLK